jgi:hypothetical protein
MNPEAKPAEKLAEVLDVPPKEEPSLLDKMVEDQDERLMASWSRNSPVAFTNLDQSGPAGRAMVTRAMATADLKTRSAVGHTIKVIGYVAHVATLTDKVTGECTTKMRVVLFLEDGKTLSSMSSAVVRTVRYLATVCANHLWEPPIELEVREHALDGGKSYCDMREVAPTPANASKSKK